MTEREQVRGLVHDAASAADFVRATFAGPARAGACPWRRVVVRPVEVRGERMVQFSYFDERKDVTRNVPPQEAAALLDELLAFAFAGVHLTTGREEIDIRTTKKDKVQIGRRRAQSAAADVSHNRV